MATKAFVELVNQIDRPNLVPKIDYWSMYLRGETLGDELRRLVPAMRLTTVADYTVLPRYRYDPSLVNYREIVPWLVMAVPMGSGDMGYASFFEFLVAAGFDGWCSYEMCSPIKGGGSLENLERYATRFLEYMREIEPRASSFALKGTGQSGRPASPARL